MNAKETIQKYLDERAKTDELFAKSYSKAEKNIDECLRYIITEARRRADGETTCMSDDEVFSLAVHYYDEDHIEVDQKVDASKVKVVNAAAEIELTDEEKAQARERAIRAYQEKCIEEEKAKAAARAKAKKKAKEEAKTTYRQTSFFDMMP